MAAGLEFLYGIILVLVICLVICLLIFWLQWRKRHTKETQEVRVIFPDGTVRRTIVTKSDIWPHLGRFGGADTPEEDKDKLTENDHIEIIFGDGQLVETENNNTRSHRRSNGQVFPIPGVTVTSDDL